MKVCSKLLPLALIAALNFASLAKAAPQPSGPQADGSFRKVILVSDNDTTGDNQTEDNLKDPMELSIAKDGRVFWAQRNGEVHFWAPKTRATTMVGKLDVFTGLEDGLLGITLDPNFQENNHLYLFYAHPHTVVEHVNRKPRKKGYNLVSRFTLKDGKLDHFSEKEMIRIKTQRDQCCHSGGSLTFDSEGNLYASVGDNTNPFNSDGFAPIDERNGRFAWDAQKSSGNANDLRGKILRVTPQPDGSVKIPKGNLFDSVEDGARSEVFVMGNRNPFRISVDSKTGFLYWGEVGPDAGGRRDGRGPAGYDEINQARGAGNFGWPHFIANNKPYNRYDFAGKKPLDPFAPAKPLNKSPNNTGIEELPAAQSAFIYYAHFPSVKWQALNSGGGRTAMAGPVYYFDENLESANKLPKSYDHSLFIYEWSRNWIVNVKLDENDNFAGMERFCPKMTFKRPMDMELGPDGCLYVIEWGTAWGKNHDTQIVRIEYHQSDQASVSK
jgi:cytochrome c